MKATLIFIKMIICIGIIVPALLFSFSRDVFADNCIYAEHSPTKSWPEDICHSYECGSPSGLCSSGFQHYSCDYYKVLGGAWGCYWQAYNCQSACGGGGGGGVSKEQPRNLGDPPEGSGQQEDITAGQVWRGSEKPIVAKKQGNACGAKGLY